MQKTANNGGFIYIILKKINNAYFKPAKYAAKLFISASDNDLA